MPIPASRAGPSITAGSASRRNGRTANGRPPSSSSASSGHSNSWIQELRAQRRHHLHRPRTAGANSRRTAPAPPAGSG